MSYKRDKSFSPISSGLPDYLTQIGGINKDKSFLHRPLNLIITFTVFLQLMLCIGFSQGMISPFYFISCQLIVFFLMLFMAKPKIAVMVFLLVRPTLDYLKPFSDIQFQMNSSINLAAMATALILLCGAVYILIHRIRVFRLPLVIPFFLFIGACFISLFISPTEIEGLFDWVRLASLFIFYILILITFTSLKDIQRLIYIIFLSAVVPLLVGFYQIAIRTGLTEVTGYFITISFHRIYSTFTHPNIYAFYLVTLLPMSILVFLESKGGIKKICLGIFIAALGFSLIFTFTRSAWISLLCAIFTFGISKYRKPLIIILLVILALTLLVPEIFRRFADLSGSTYDGLDSFRWRLHLWRQMFGLFLTSPILGHGLGSFQQLSYAVQSEYAAAHNDYLRLAIEIGALGLGIYLFLLFSITRSAFSLYKRLCVPLFKAITLGFLSLCVAYIIIGLSDNLVRSTVVQLYFWTFAAVMFNVSQIENRLKNFRGAISR